MKHSLKVSASENSAAVVDGKLILSLPGAVSPVVWQMDLDQTKSSALEIRENKNDSTFTFVLKTGSAQSTDIATFQTRDHAVQVLMAVSRALEKAQGKIRPAGSGSDRSPVYSGASSSAGSTLLAITLGVLLLFILLNAWSSMSSGAGTMTTEESAATEQKTTAPSSDGVPLSADEFLRK